MSGGRRPQKGIDEFTEAVMAGFDLETFRDLLVEFVNTPSPTGHEADLANLIVNRLRESGVRAEVQELDEHQANAVGRVGRNSGDGADLLLYAPIDTHLDADASADIPYVGPAIDPLYRARAIVDGWEVGGLGAENPKAYAASVVTAARLLQPWADELVGEVVVGLGAGGMPVNPPPGARRRNLGQGTGCAFMLEQGVRADYAILAKPVWAVQWEEVGITWHRVRVHGLYGYSGLRHAMRYDNPVATAARVIEALERWLPEYSVEHTSGMVAPQGVVSAVEGGWPNKPAFVPAAVDVYLDIRVSPRDDPQDVARALRRRLCAFEEENPGTRLDHEMILAIPGSHTPPDDWIITSMIRAWEAVSGESHVPATGLSGATDVAILRMWGIPTGRVGMPYRPGGEFVGALGSDPLPMNVVNINDCARLVELLVRVSLDTCTRTIDQTRGATATHEHRG